MANNDWLKQNFETKRMALKGVSTAAWLALVMWLIHAVQTKDFSPTADIQATVAIVASSIGAGLLVSLRNWLKNYLGWDISAWFGVVLFAIALQGCASMTPALAGKTNLSTEFRDVVNADGTQDTHYSQTVKAPAGVDLKNIASMQYNWDGKGGGNVAVASEPQANTQGQADALVKVNQQQMDLIGKLMEQIVQLAGIASPLIGQNLSNSAASDQLNAATKAAIIDAVKTTLQQQGAASKSYITLPK